MLLSTNSLQSRGPCRIPFSMSQFQTSSRKGRKDLSSSQTTRFPSIDPQSNKKLVAFSDVKAEDDPVVKMRNMKRVTFMQLDDKKKRKDQNDSPYRWIEEDTLYLRQYGHHLVDKDDDIDLSARKRGRNGCGGTRCSNHAELGEDLWGGECHSPTYKHIPGGYKKPLSSERRGCSSPYSLVFASVPSRAVSSSSRPCPAWKEESYGDIGKSSAAASQKKSFLPPIDPHIISVKKKYGLL